MRKTFYPYGANNYSIKLSMTVATKDWTNIKPIDIDLQLAPVDLKEELDTWLDLYGIDECYKVKCCGKEDGKYWIGQVLDEYYNEGTLPETIYNRIKRHAENSPFADTNFLKACFDQGIFDSMDAVGN